ncbi:sporulation initiation inhibitor protein Soj [Spirochaetota bacterium]|nr:sporulation initiation inhibitor protein Soj [Spirochaetota bacterium]
MAGKVIAISNQKGGVAKTTTVINLAYELTRLGKRILIVDGDPQANATSGLAVKFAADKTLYEVLVAAVDAHESLVETRYPGLDIIPSKPELSGAQIELSAQAGHEIFMKQALHGFKSTYDFILIDTPPSLGLLTLNAFTASNSILIPIQCEYYALEGITQLLSTIKLVKEHTNPALFLEGILLTMYDKRTKLSYEVAQNVLAHFRDKTYKAIIPRSVKLSEAPSHGVPVGVYAPESLGAQSYRQLAKEFLPT